MEARVEDEAKRLPSNRRRQLGAPKMHGWLIVGIVLVVAALAATLVGVTVLLVKMVRIRALLRSAGVPRAGKVAFWASIVYLVCPVDLLPDPIFLDDIGFLLLALRSLKTTVQQAGLAIGPRDEVAGAYGPLPPRLPSGSRGESTGKPGNGP
jgi:uncharacterized membrane protein YkvA (DUF1232 family)